MDKKTILCDNIKSPEEERELLAIIRKNVSELIGENGQLQADLTRAKADLTLAKRNIIQLKRGIVAITALTLSLVAAVWANSSS